MRGGTRGTRANPGPKGPQGNNRSQDGRGGALGTPAVPLTKDAVSSTPSVTGWEQSRVNLTVFFLPTFTPWGDGGSHTVNGRAAREANRDSMRHWCENAAVRCGAGDAGATPWKPWKPWFDWCGPPRGFQRKTEALVIPRLPAGLRSLPPPSDPVVRGFMTISANSAECHRRPPGLAVRSRPLACWQVCIVSSPPASCRCNGMAATQSGIGNMSAQGLGVGNGGPWSTQRPKPCLDEARIGRTARL